MLPRPAQTSGSRTSSPWILGVATQGRGPSREPDWKQMLPPTRSALCLAGFRPDGCSGARAGGSELSPISRVPKSRATHAQLDGSPRT